jgi:hypothetical protein
MHPARALMRRGIIDTLFSLIFLTGISCVHAARALSQQLGDLNNDGTVNVLDLVILIDHVNTVSGTGVESAKPPPTNFILFADLNGHGNLNQADVDTLADAVLGTTNGTLGNGASTSAAPPSNTR